MREDTLKALEYDKILNKLEALSFTKGGKELSRNLLPYESFEETTVALKETTDAKKFLEKEGDLPFIEFIDVEPLFEKIKVLSLVTPEEILRVSDVLSAFSEIKEIGESYRETYPEVFKYIMKLSNFEDIVKAIRKVVGNDGKIVDDASPLLSIIRREIKTTYLRIQSILQEILYSRENEDAIQDKIITKRNDRYVIPIRLNSKPSFNYVVQGESGSKLTLFVEPMAVVELNNKLVDLFSKERREEERIVLELEERIRNKFSAVEESLNIIYKLDFIFAKARLSLEFKASEPILVNEPYLELYEARNPFINDDVVVPIDIEVGKNFKMLIITGPNTGGKTVTLKTTGLLTLMAKAGMHIPAISNSTVGFFRDVFADIGDEQSIEQNLSTFSSHMVRIIDILKNATKDDLVLIDELGAGTDPEEGASLGFAILKRLYKIGASSIVTTHHGKIKEFPYKFKEAQNASVGFDVDTLSPTYKLYIGIPGESHALIIAERLGMPEDVLSDARSELSSDFIEKAEIVSKMHEDNRAIEIMKRDTEVAKNEAMRLKETYEQKLKELEERKRLEIRKAYEEAQRIIDETKEKMNKILENLDVSIKSQKEIQEMKKALKSEEQKIEEQQEKTFEEVNKVGPSEIKEGILVYVRTLKAQGIVLQVKNDEQKAIVQMGAIRATLKFSDLEPVSEEKVEVKKEKRGELKELFEEELPMMIDLHGYTVDDAIDILDKYLDKAYLHGLPHVYIVHGKGTGALREAILQYLRNNKRIARFETGTPSEGGIGTTIVFFR
ncbi:endonuclease MutS2 [Caldisericum exile]|uniref:Endonuclease MutS2 n=1 Tax=Caldisericum exile (strain DSM 21853 / NBRC 104410 / AZM16c01) TaxID=511051 RepID=A0A7U6GEX6_CALEA|nr:endonuclease MutS2 [Caldisericum exile]BAL81136.1 MutS2 protein [Caldisericum exile AZM16c01]